jgi:hypothetical protein
VTGPMLASVIGALAMVVLASGLEIRLFADLGRVPRSRWLVELFELIRGSRRPRRRDAVAVVVLLFVFQLLPIGSEGLIFGAGTTPDHITGISVIAGEIILAGLLWLGTAGPPQ